jgi:hypothetical protein
VVFQRIDDLGGGFSGRAKGFVAGRLAVEAASASVIRRGDGSAPPSPTRALAILPLCRDRSQARPPWQIARTAAEFVETEPGIIRQQRERASTSSSSSASAVDMIPEKNCFAAIKRSPRALLATSVARVCRDEAPFRRRVGMGETSAECAAHADRIVRDMARDSAQQCTERIFSDRLMKRRMPHAGADRQRLSVTRDLVEACDLIDVHKMRGFGEPESHNRDKALSASQHAAVCGATSARILTASSRVFGVWRMKGAGFIRVDFPARPNYLYANVKAPWGLSNDRAAKGCDSLCKAAVFSSESSDLYCSASVGGVAKREPGMLMARSIVAACLVGCVLAAVPALAQDSKRPDKFHSILLPTRTTGSCS